MRWTCVRSSQLGGPRPRRARYVSAGRPAREIFTTSVCLSVTLCVMISGIVAQTSDCLFRATMGNQAVLR